MNVFAHNTTTIRSLAEIRHRENIPPVETQYQPPDPMRTVLPDPVTPSEVQKVIADIKDLKRPKPVSPPGFFYEKLKGKGPEEPTLAPTPKRPIWNTFAKISGEDQPGPSSSEVPCCRPGEQEGALQPAPAPAPITELEPEIIKPGEKPARVSIISRPNKSADPTPAGQNEQSKQSQQSQGRVDQPGTKPSIGSTGTGPREGGKKTKLGGLFRRSKTSSDSGPTPEVKNATSAMAKLSVEATKAAYDLQRLQGDIPEIRIGEGPVSKEEREEMLKRYQAMLEAGVDDSLAMLKAASNLGSIQPIIELPPARNHSLSEDTVFTPKAARERLHSLSTDALVGSSKAAPNHDLHHDAIIEAKPLASRAHRLSADATIPVQTAAPGHYLDADPTVNTPRQLFSHELLEDAVVHRQTKSPKPHGLDSDMKLQLAQKDRQSHGLHSDKQISMAQSQPQAHGIHIDKVLPGLARSRQHDLHADHVVIPKASGRSAHDIAHDVRILSPSGQVRDPHSMGADEVIKQTAVFRKSPHPEAMPGHYAGSSSSADASDNAMASLNASLQNAGQALGELNRALEGQPGKENDASRMSPSGQGFWGRMFGRREDQEEGQDSGEEVVRGSQGTHGVQETSAQ